MAHKLIFSIKVVLYATLFIIIDKNKMNVIQTHKNTCKICFLIATKTYIDHVVGRICCEPCTKVSPLENACLYPIFAPVTEELQGLY